mmetsp:Transcript_9522/g.26784  ORF Transcript_9522/g.26784 Transcript_9522/m.26784 type:complete len:827 (-) Transcript_9522:150-2630(-)
MAQQNGQDNAQGQQKVVGPNIKGSKEDYRLERKLQAGLFGGVYEAKGLTSSRSFAVKVLHQSEILKAQQTNAIEFCEVPLSEIEYIEQMRGCEHVMEVEDHFKDQYCHYIVFDLAPGGDLLELLKTRPNGFEEQQAQFLIGQAARGLSWLHQQHMAMQDVSLENMLINYLEDGQYQIKICDPGQATLFETGSGGEELPVQFRGFVGKSFRPPELCFQKPYYASKVDAWCLGWSTFYLLAAQPLFLSADPQMQDADWIMFQKGQITELFEAKGVSRCSRKCMDFILRLMRLDPKDRLSVAEALQHEWLSGCDARPMYDPARSPKVLSSPVKTKTPTNPSSTLPQGSGTSVGVGLVGAGSQSGSVQAAAGRSGSGLSPDAGRAGRNRNLQPGPSRLAAQQSVANASSRAASRGQAPAWKMAPASRSESPSPGPSAGGSSALAFRQPQQQGTRTASPFAANGARDGDLARQLGTPRRPEPAAARGLPSLRGIAGMGGGSTALQANSLHHSEATAGLGSRAAQYAGPAPTPTATANGSEAGGSSPTGGGYSANTPTAIHSSAGGAVGVGEGHASGTTMAPVASRATSGQSGRQQQLSGLSDGGHSASGGSGIQAIGGLVAAHTGGSQRTSSPMQTQFVIRPGTTGRGYSPGPAGTLGAPLGTLGAQVQSRTGSPMQQHGTGTGVPAVIGASRGTVSGSAIIEGGGGHYWQSPRTGSPGSTVIRPGEASFPRGRSTTRASSPSQVTAAHSPTTIVNTYGNSPGSPQVMRSVSPNIVASTVPSRAAGSSGGIAWNPAPLSPPPNKRSVSPVPSPVGVVINSSVPKWVAQTMY